MTSSLITRPPTDEEREFHKRSWQKIVDDPAYANLQGKFESDRHGHLVMSPPPGRKHGKLQQEIGYLLKVFLGDSGSVGSECPITTSDGVKSAYVAWISFERESHLAEDNPCYTICPEICVEIISPSNTAEEMQEKMELYFAAGAEEVWFCEDGEMRFHHSLDAPASQTSTRCPSMPASISV